MVNQLLTEMDGFRKNEMIFVIGTTNYLESLDGALCVRAASSFSSRFPRRAPTTARPSCASTTRSLASGSTRPSCEHLVRRTEGYADREKGIPFSGDHLQAVCRALKRQQIRDGEKAFTTDDIDRALQRKTRRPIVLSPEEERVIAIHEAGHALVAMLIPKATPPEKICIAQDQEGALGYVMRAARTRPYTTTDEEMRADICVGLGGQTAERLVLGEVSVGAYGDLQQCNAIARAMVEQYGMSQRLGPRVVLDDEIARDGSAGRGVAEARRTLLDAEVERILREEQARCERVLMDNLALHDALARLLLEKKVLDAAALKGFAPKGE
jgi:cell division protease FtsH